MRCRSARWTCRPSPFWQRRRHSSSRLRCRLRPTSTSRPRSFTRASAPPPPRPSCCSSRRRRPRPSPARRAPTPPTTAALVPTAKVGAKTTRQNRAPFQCVWFLFIIYPACAEFVISQNASSALPRVSIRSPVKISPVVQLLQEFWHL